MPGGTPRGAAGILLLGLLPGLLAWSGHARGQERPLEHFEAGREALDEGDLRSAARSLLEAARAEPSEGVYVDWLGQVLVERVVPRSPGPEARARSIEQAVAVLEELQESGGTWEARWWLANALALRSGPGDADRARALLEDERLRAGLVGTGREAGLERLLAGLGGRSPDTEDLREGTQAGGATGEAGEGAGGGPEAPAGGAPDAPRGERAPEAPAEHRAPSGNGDPAGSAGGVLLDLAALGGILVLAVGAVIALRRFVFDESSRGRDALLLVAFLLVLALAAARLEILDGEQLTRIFTGALPGPSGGDGAGDGG